ncbi:MAG: hypothetical protein Ct9H300mP12_09440 [Acidimicrobiales bacterium]|nr:MAG: hypothetical protein Ct9H300mP12_09440 [Acidimicrobiales bacterium]
MMLSLVGPPRRIDEFEDCCAPTASSKYSAPARGALASLDDALD